MYLLACCCVLGNKRWLSAVYWLHVGGHQVQMSYFYTSSWQSESSIFHFLAKQQKAFHMKRDNFRSAIRYCRSQCVCGDYHLFLSFLFLLFSSALFQTKTTYLQSNNYDDQSSHHLISEWFDWVEPNETGGDWSQRHALHNRIDSWNLMIDILAPDCHRSSFVFDWQIPIAPADGLH